MFGSHFFGQPYPGQGYAGATDAVIVLLGDVLEATVVSRMDARAVVSRLPDRTVDGFTYDVVSRLGDRTVASRLARRTVRHS
jgi:hypothetical protein